MTDQSKKQKRIDQIRKNIERLNLERDKIKTDMTKELIDILVKKNALRYDFEMLKGGLLHVLDILSRSDKEAEEHKKSWTAHTIKKSKAPAKATTPS
jgi:hypothetical protein